MLFFMMIWFLFIFFFFFFNDTATTEIYTLSLHDALPICDRGELAADQGTCGTPARDASGSAGEKNATEANHESCTDRKSTRLNSSHGYISYAVFCLKKKKKTQK